MIDILKFDITEQLLADGISEEYIKWLKEMTVEQFIVLLKTCVSGYIKKLKPNQILKDKYHA